MFGMGLLHEKAIEEEDMLLKMHHHLPAADTEIEVTACAKELH